MFLTVRVKICGITDLSDALAASEAGADALGFMFYEPSPRCLSFEAAAAITRQLPPFIAKVGVFVDPALDFVNEAVVQCGLDAVQLHGSETPDFCERVHRPVIKAFRVDTPASLDRVRDYQTAAWLLDSFVPGKLGGTGVQFNWKLAVRAKAWGRPILLAGGLTPENIAAAVEEVRPYGVDVSSGVERAPGKKDSEKMRAFIAAAKRVPS
jgi:phosphoribosylanthranilate isomerase